ncbi:MAG: DUF4430 domain-containing protein [Actinobacteria bacterium]|nr:DUF4430 domain-containing protein [Actinomycetota bacterium]
MSVSSMMRPVTALLVASLLATVVGGCGAGAGPGDGSVKLTVSRDFGRVEVLQRSLTGLPQSETVMRLLSSNTKTETSYSGGFVDSVNGVSGGQSGGRSVDWFYFVNGSEAPLGAASTKVRDGDRIWWDWRDWGAADHVPAVVGSFPEPFLHGPGTEKRLPVRVECVEIESAPCKQVSKTLAALGVPVAIGLFRASITEQTLRVIVGQWAALREEESLLQLESGPGASGVYAQPRSNGAQIDLLNARGRTVRSLGAGAGLVAATALGGQPPVWAITGTDSNGVAAAAAAFNERQLHRHYAVAVAPGSGAALSLPLAGGAK